MSTRGLFTFKDESGEYRVYKHMDCYPEGEHGAIAAIRKAIPYAWALPRFEAEDFGAAFIAANKQQGGGNVYMVLGGPWNDAAPGGIRYHYVVYFKDNELSVHVYQVANSEDGLTQTSMAYGTLEAMEHVFNEGAAASA